MDWVSSSGRTHSHVSASLMKKDIAANFIQIPLNYSLFGFNFLETVTLN